MEQDPKVITKLEEWATNQPKPSDPLLIIGKNSYSAHQIIEQVKQKTELGMKIYKEFAKDNS